jgi:hypothetical protein
MLVFGLVHDNRWQGPPPDDGPPPRDDGAPTRPERHWHLPWRSLAWVAVWCWLMALVPVVSGAFGGLAGFAVLILAVGLGLWRLDRWLARQYWHGLREYRL